MGGITILLSNKRSDSGRAKYELVHVVRTNHAANDEAYRCAYQEEDVEGNIVISLSKNLTAIAGAALKENITTIAPLVLPPSELLRWALGCIMKKTYTPDFRKAFKHFCIHAGGRAVIEELSKKLKLMEERVEPSRMTLHRLGNTSSSSPWYELSYVEAKGRMKKGDRVWKIRLGSGLEVGLNATT
ncbi:uncharacterized protein A4U43_C03F2550 [Asparagus officinalis]|uniref:very-long-chain 3-oxoacyl-CoA synthase n=1 Tax=Asparagus officinalis TaxID=4686 RepID=A0A5P1F6U2_ASPOF|nr:uncharacterized protein A4U43_C03F2550 [Asparagus officinalis]